MPNYTKPSIVAFRPANLLIAAIAASREKINECKYQWHRQARKFSLVRSHPLHRTRAVLLQRSHVPSVPSACPVEARSRHRFNDFRLSCLSRLSQLSRHVLGTPHWW